MVRERKTTIEPFHGPRAEGEGVYGLEHDGERLWCATGKALVAIDPATGATLRRVTIPAGAGTTFDGTHVYQLDGEHIRKVDPESGAIVGTIPAPDGSGSGMVWAEGSLWVGRYRDRRIHRVDPATGEILATIETRRFVTGVTFLAGQLWHGADPDEGEEAGFELHRYDPDTGELLERATVDTPVVTGMTPDDRGGLYCGGGDEGTIRRLTLEND